METVDLKRLSKGSEEDGFSCRLILSGEDLAFVIWTLGPRRRMPELVFSRGQSVYHVLEGSIRLQSGDQSRRLDEGQLLGIERGVSHQCSNPSDSPACVLLVRSPGPVRVDDIGVGKAVCQICAGSTPVEKGDRAGDRFVCRDCGCVMVLQDVQGVLRPAKFEPEQVTEQD